jgi:hypothetical protein
MLHPESDIANTSNDATSHLKKVFWPNIFVGGKILFLRWLLIKSLVGDAALILIFLLQIMLHLLELNFVNFTACISLSENFQRVAIATARRMIT